MSLLQQGFLRLKSPFTEFRRFRGKIHIRRPRIPNFHLQTILDVTKPFYKPIGNDVPEYVKCSNVVKRFEFQKRDNPFAHILARECANWFKHSKMVAFLHLNPMEAEEQNSVKKLLKRENMFLKQYGKELVHEAVINTPFEKVYELFESHTCMVFSRDVKADKMLKILKKCPQLVFLAGIIDGKLLSKDTFVEYSNFPSLDVMRSNLCNVLLSSGMQLTNQLMQHQMSLVNNLDAYVQMKQTEENKQEDINSKNNPEDIKTE